MRGSESKKIERIFPMPKKTTGIILLIVGIVGLVVVYSLKPPSGFGEALMILGEGRQYYLKEPWYQLFLIASVVIGGFGAFRIFKATQESDKNKSSENPGT
jgi:hypothetical protein